MQKRAMKSIAVAKDLRTSSHREYSKTNAAKYFTGWTVMTINENKAHDRAVSPARDDARCVTKARATKANTARFGRNLFAETCVRELTLKQSKSVFPMYLVQE